MQFSMRKCRVRRFDALAWALWLLFLSNIVRSVGFPALFFFRQILTVSLPELLRANGIAPPPERAQKRKASEPPQAESASTDQEADPDAQEAARLKVSSTS